MVLRGPSWIKRGSSRPFVDKKVFSAALRGPSWIKRCSPRPFVALRGSKGVLRGPSWPFVDQKVFFVVLRGPSWIKRCSSRPFVAHAAELRGSPTLCRASFACLSSSSWINLPFQPTQKVSAKQPSTERPPSRKSQEILQFLLQTTFTRNPRQTHPKILG